MNWRRWTDADTADFERRWEAQEEEARRVFASRAGEPPRWSRAGGPPADWKRWNVLLDDLPVGSCSEFDVGAGWVMVWPLVRVANAPPSRQHRSATAPQRRLYGQVQAVLQEDHTRLVAERGMLNIYEDEARGEPIPGTDARSLAAKRQARQDRDLGDG